MKFFPAICNQLLQGTKVAVNNFSSFKTIDDFGADIRTTANGRGITKRLRRFFDRGDNFSFAAGLLFDYFRAYSSKSARADKRTRPSAKIFRTELFAHDFA